MSNLPDLATEDTRLGLIFDTLGPAPKTNAGQRKLNKKCKTWICELMAIVPSRQLAATHLGITTRTINREMHRDPEFMRNYKEAQAEGNSNVASMVYEQAAGLGLTYEVVKEGSKAKLIAVPQERSEKMLEMLFKLEHKDVFFRRDVHHSGSVDQRPPGSLCIYVEPDQLMKLTKEEQRQLTGIIAKLEALKPRVINGESVPVESPEPQRIAHG